MRLQRISVIFLLLVLLAGLLTQTSPRVVSAAPVQPATRLYHPILSVSTQCLPDGSTNFMVTNSGVSMSSATNWRLFVNGTQTETGTIQLTAGEVKTLNFKFTGDLLRLEVDQASDFPLGGFASAQATCGTKIPLGYCFSDHPETTILYNQFLPSDTSNVAWDPAEFRETVSPSGERFMGEFSNEGINMTVSCLPPHTSVSLTFDVYVIRSWDGTKEIGSTIGPDIFQVTQEGSTTPLLTTTFTNWVTFEQAYPGQYPANLFPAHTGAMLINTLGYKYANIAQDSIYRIHLDIPHTGDTLTVRFAAMGLQPINDESWGLDNVVLWPTQPSAAGFVGNPVLLPMIRH